ncbi:MAG TPA: SGNH/GDSL hydrolase family protein, partial [Candidatus Dormibacteraeota bacterium]
MKHVVLLGDSVFDNAAYVGGGPDVVTQLRQRLPSGWRASLLAVDGSVIASIAQQLARLPADASHLVISVGGNDALGYAS